MKQMILAAASVGLIFGGYVSAAVTVTAKNELDIARPSETIELQWTDVAKAIPGAKADGVQVVDSAGKPVVSQAVDLSGGGTPAELVFQADFGPGETKTFALQPGAPATTAPKVFGRHVPERLDDFAWENDHIAFRVYGPALEKVEPGSNGVDVWVKRTRNLIVDKWYGIAEPNDPGYYHIDHGDGFDGYKVGTGRGCGGDAIWKDGKMYDSGIKGWATQKVLANGPIRLVFELTYVPFDAAGEKIGETKRVTLDAGQNLNRFEDTFTSDKADSDLTVMVGISKHNKPGKAAIHKDQGWMRYWDAADSVDKPRKDNGNIGCGVVMNPAQVLDTQDTKEHIFTLVKGKSGQPITFYAGAGWDRSDDFHNIGDWDKYLEEFSKRAASPLKVNISQ